MDVSQTALIIIWLKGKMDIGTKRGNVLPEPGFPVEKKPDLVAFVVFLVTLQKSRQTFGHFVRDFLL